MEVANIRRAPTTLLGGIAFCYILAIGVAALSSIAEDQLADIVLQ